MSLQQAIRTGQCSIVDVRTPEEFSGGSVAGAINIPLHELPDKLEELEQLAKPLVLCCASGNRSERAQQFLTSRGVKEVLDGGSWLNVNNLQHN